MLDKLYALFSPDDSVDNIKTAKATGEEDCFCLSADTASVSTSVKTLPF